MKVKGLVIASILFFSLRAISAEVGENQKSECPYGNQSKRVLSEKVTNADADNTVKTSSPKVISQ